MVIQLAEVIVGQFIQQLGPPATMATRGRRTMCVMGLGGVWVRPYAQVRLNVSRGIRPAVPLVFRLMWLQVLPVTMVTPAL